MSNTTLKNQEITNPIITANAEMFIIPNSACNLDGYCVESHKNKLRKILDDNNLEFDSKEKFVQLWFTSEEDLKSENLARHGLRFNYEGKVWHSILPSEEIPQRLLDIKEGEVSKIIFKDILCVGDEEGDQKKFDIVLNCKANQLAYRYRSFGPFERVLAKVTR